MLGPKAQLMLRYPDGKREQISLPEQAKLLVSGVNRNPCLSTGELKLENFFARGGAIEIGSSESGISRECLHCHSVVSSVSFLSSDQQTLLALYVSIAAWVVCMLQCLP